jgi:hypothetical protein
MQDNRKRDTINRVSVTVPIRSQIICTDTVRYLIPCTCMFLRSYTLQVQPDSTFSNFELEKLNLGPKLYPNYEISFLKSCCDTVQFGQARRLLQANPSLNKSVHMGYHSLELIPLLINIRCAGEDLGVGAADDTLDRYRETVRGHTACRLLGK